MRKRQRKRSKRTKKRGIYVLPNLFTSASLFSGFYAIIAAIQLRYESAAIAILLACVFDALDGKIARVTHSTSPFGKEYDSLSDLVAFGVAPGLLAFQWALAPFGRLGWLASFMYLICGALRLARFNVQSSNLRIGYFKGLPIPGAAGFVASLILFSTALGGMPEFRHILFIIIIYVLSFLMVSAVEYPSFKGLELSRQRQFNAFVSIILVLIVVAYKPKIMIFFMMATYILSGPALTVYRHQKTRAVDEPLPKDRSALDKTGDQKSLLEKR